ncbi:Stk1 family PASTA domain-containing Ser/Thr kinase [Rhodococcus sp. X156]|uniref:Stk1 family PASTA domain-containing Ser/Thr kinase n=1 Tax=Rhodococcus sp. X156 TaxID=2499145 RepID=UPI000FDCA36C|nr:Stk1 family PASTA domain-containing Ser/Thr kinase [Rhodococcus sp. X156]
MRSSGSELLGVLLDGRYRIDSPIAHGGMSTVYRGVDLRLDRPVAIKVMAPHFADDPAFLARFELEARSVARLSHAGLVAVYDQGRDDGHVFLVMELVEGGTLRGLLQQNGALSVPVAFAVMEPVLAALATAHRAGLVHRDVKPENILIAEDGAVKVADFGLVRAAAAAGVTANNGVILGTAAYLSPEQVSPGTADARSDVYSTGILLYEMLTGTPPYTGDSALSVAYQHVNNDTSAPSLRVRGLAPELDDLVLRATRRDPAARFVDAGQMLAEVLELRRWLHVPSVRVPLPQPVSPHAVGVRPPVPADPAKGTEGAPDEPTVPARRTTVMSGAMPGATSTRGYPRTGSAAMEVPVNDSEYSLLRQRGRRVALVWVLVVLLLAVAVGVGGWWLGSGRFTTVPNLTGLSHGEAQQVLEDVDLKAEARDGYDNTAPISQVLAARPAPGAKVAKGSTVVLTVSLGRPVVPTIVSGTISAAVSEQLRQHGLLPVLAPGAHSETVAEGGLLRLSPEPGTVLTVDAPVQVTLSLGPPPVRVPDVAGRSAEEATAVLGDSGLTVGGTIPVYSSAVPAGSVVGSEPAAGAESRRGSAVTLQVSNALSVPDVTGTSPAEATARLSAAGFAPVIGATVFDPAADAGSVASTVPPAGTLVDPATPQVQVQISDAVTVPGVRGRTVDSARAALAELGLRVKVQQLVPFDGSLVVGQSAEGGSRVAPGAEVTITALP